MTENRLSKEDRRYKAIELWKQDWKVTEICSTLGCSRSWFYKWLERYDENNDSWFKEESRAPRSIPGKVDKGVEQLVVDTRKELMAAPFSQYGPQAIYYTLLQKGYSPPPPWTIARIVYRHDLVRKKKTGSYIAKGKTYPYSYCLAHQMDFVGPRYLSSKARYYFLSLIDCDGHWCQTSVLDNRRALSVCECLIRFWKGAGIPDFLQMDNDLSFWGSMNRPGAVGKVTRLCLLHGVTPVFIPQGEPWRNGIVEWFNNTMQKHLLSHDYANLEQLKKAAVHYDQVHNEDHHYSSQNGMTPKQAFQRLDYPLVPLDQSYAMPKGNLPLERGEIHIIRFIRSDCKFNLFGLSFLLPEEAKYEYVKGIILTEEHRLLVFKDQQFITDFEFILY